MKVKNHYFVLRHGDTVWTKTEKIYPWPDGLNVHLTAEGKEAIRRAAKRLKGEKIDLIFSSDLYRTKQSSGIVAKELKLKVKFDKRLRDTFLGKYYHGRLKKDFYADFPDPTKRFTTGPKGGETWNDVRQRVKSFLLDVEKENQGKNILIIGHGDPLWLLEGLVHNMTNEELLKHGIINKAELKEL